MCDETERDWDAEFEEADNQDPHREDLPYWGCDEEDD